MQKILLDLRQWGCDIDGALDRFLYDENLYISCLKSVTNGKMYEDLKRALDEKDCKRAFEYAHSIKGVSANLGLQPIVEEVSFLVEPLRSGCMENLETPYQDLCKKISEYIAILRDNNLV